MQVWQEKQWQVPGVWQGGVHVCVTRETMTGTWCMTRWVPCWCDKRNNDRYLVGQGGVHVGATVEFSLQQLRLFPTAGTVQEGWLGARVKRCQGSGGSAATGKPRHWVCSCLSWPIQLSVFFLSWPIQLSISFLSWPIWLSMSFLSQPVQLSMSFLSWPIQLLMSFMANTAVNVFLVMANTAVNVFLVMANTAVNIFLVMVNTAVDVFHGQYSCQCLSCHGQYSCQCLIVMANTAVNISCHSQYSCQSFLSWPIQPSKSFLLDQYSSQCLSFHGGYCRQCLYSHGQYSFQSLVIILPITILSPVGLLPTGNKGHFPHRKPATWPRPSPNGGGNFTEYCQGYSLFFPLPSTQEI